MGKACKLWCKACPCGWRAVSQAQLLQRCKRQSLCPASAWKGDKKGQGEAVQRKLKSSAPLHMPGHVRRESLAKKWTSSIQCIRSGLSWYSCDLLLTSRLLKKCFYPLSALTANLSLASGAGNGSIIREQTGKEPRAGKLRSDGCLPPPRLCGLSAAGEAARAAGEGLFHGLI